MILFQHYKEFATFNSKKLSANAENTKYTVGVNGNVVNGTDIDIKYQTVAFIQDTKQIWTHGTLYDGSLQDISDFVDKDELKNYLKVTENEEGYKVIDDLIVVSNSMGVGGLASGDGGGVLMHDGGIITSGILAPQYNFGFNDALALIDSGDVALVTGIMDGETVTKPLSFANHQHDNYLTSDDIKNKVDSSVLADVATSGSYNDLTDKPSIPTADTVGGWGYTKNTGTITGVNVNGTSVATEGVANIPSADGSTYGVTKLYSGVDSSSEVLAATPKAVKNAYETAKAKQEKLVSGTNIRTVNGFDVLGSGNITVGNIEGVDVGGILDEIETDVFVRFVTQSLTDAQKTQARTNIYAASKKIEDEWEWYEG